MMDPKTVENEILNGMIASGQQVHGIPDATWYEPPDAENPLPRLRTPERMQERFGITPDKYNEVVGGALSNYLPQANYMADRYNAVTHDSNPWPAAAPTTASPWPAALHARRSPEAAVETRAASAWPPSRQPLRMLR